MTKLCGALSRFSNFKVVSSITHGTFFTFLDECGYVEANRCFLELTTLDLSDLESSCR